MSGAITQRRREGCRVLNRGANRKHRNQRASVSQVLSANNSSISFYFSESNRSNCCSYRKKDREGVGVSVESETSS